MFAEHMQSCSAAKTEKKMQAVIPGYINCSRNYTEMCSALRTGRLVCLCVDHKSRKTEQNLTHWVWPLLKPVSPPPQDFHPIPKREVVEIRDSSRSLAQPTEARGQAGNREPSSVLTLQYTDFHHVAQSTSNYPRLQIPQCAQQSILRHKPDLGHGGLES